MPKPKRRMLVKIGTKVRALSILSCFPEKQYAFVIVRCRNVSDLNPDLVALIFPDYANSITWSDIFVFSRGLNSVSGIVAIRREACRLPIAEFPKNTQRALRYFDDSVVYSYSLSDAATFRASLMNCNATMEYAKRDVLAKRKSSPENEVQHAQQVNEPNSKQYTVVSNPLNPVSTKLIVNVKPAQPKLISAPIKEVKEPQTNKTPAGKAKDEPKVNFTIRDSEFVPITSESVGYILDLMKQFEREGRVVAVVFDRYFNYPDISMVTIRRKFEPFFGALGDDCVFIKSNLSQMMPNLDEAYKREFIFKGQAYIVSKKGTDRGKFVSMASQSTILFGVLTMGCVMMNLKRGAFLLNRSALPKIGAPKTTVICQPVEESTKALESKAIDNSGQTNKRHRVAATFTAPPKKGEKSSKADDIVGDLFDQKEMEKFIRCSDVVTETMHIMQPFGNAVVRIDNLPAKLTINAFNLMMGTCSLVSNQIIGTRIDAKKKELGRMHVRIVINSDHPDLKRIMAKNKLKTVSNLSLLVKRTDLKELEKFLLANYDHLVRLAPDEMRPVNGIAYGNANQSVKTK